MSPFNKHKTRSHGTPEEPPKEGNCPVCGKPINQHGEGLETDACVRKASGSNAAGNPTISLQTAFDMLDNVPAAPRATAWSPSGDSVCMTFSNGQLEYGLTYPLIVCAMILRFAGKPSEEKFIPEVIQEEANGPDVAYGDTGDQDVPLEAEASDNDDSF